MAIDLEALADARLPVLVEAVADQIDGILIELPRQYSNPYDMAIDVIHDYARAHGVSYQQAALELLAKHQALYSPALRSHPPAAKLPS